MSRVTVIGLGGGYLDKHSLAHGVATVHRALELGINYFDTAPVYGQDASQVILGNALEGCTEPYLLATKIGFLAEPAALSVTGCAPLPALGEFTGATAEPCGHPANPSR